jgi:Sigma-70 region 2
MEAYQQGDRKAADQLIDSLSPALYRFFAVNASDRRHVDDLLQEAWLRVHKARNTYRPGEPLLWSHLRLRCEEQGSGGSHELTFPPVALVASPMSRNRSFGSFCKHSPSSRRTFAGTLPRFGCL